MDKIPVFDSWGNHVGDYIPKNGMGFILMLGVLLICAWAMPPIIFIVGFVAIVLGLLRTIGIAKPIKASLVVKFMVIACGIFAAGIVGLVPNIIHHRAPEIFPVPLDQLSMLVMAIMLGIRCFLLILGGVFASLSVTTK